MQTTDRAEGAASEDLVLELERITRGFLAAISAHDLEGIASHWAPGGIERLPSIGPIRAPEGLQEFHRGMWAALPDYRIDPIQLLVDPPWVAVHFQVNATFIGEPFQGINATGGRWTFQGMDLLRIEDGLIQELDVYFDTSEMLRGIGVLPPMGSLVERFGKRITNLRTRIRPGVPRP